MIEVYKWAAMLGVIAFVVLGAVLAVIKWVRPSKVYRRMIDFIFRPAPYLYTLEADYTCQYPVDSPDCEHPFVSVKDCVMTVRAGYSWNGCSPKHNIMDLKITGTPEGVIDFRTGKPKTYYGSLCHDVRYQYQIGSKKNADICFLCALWAADFVLADVYYWFVDKFGQKAWDKK